MIDVIKALSKRICFTGLKGHQLTNTRIQTTTEEADFEDIIIEYIDVMDLLSKVSPMKKAVVVQKAFGYPNWEIALNLGISERTVSNLIKSIKIFLRKVQR